MPSIGEGEPTPSHPLSLATLKASSPSLPPHAQAHAHSATIKIPHQRGPFRYLDTEPCPWTSTSAQRRARRTLYLSRFDRSPAIAGPVEPASIAHCEGVGYRTVLASEGLLPASTSEGWYWETAWRGTHLRLGVARPGAALCGPLGADPWGWAICSRDGGVFHGGIRSIGCEPFTEDDIIGCWLTQVSNSTPKHPLKTVTLPQRRLVSYYGAYFEERIDHQDPPTDVNGSARAGNESDIRSHPVLKVYKNGRQIQTISLPPPPFPAPLCCYYPAFSLYPGTSIEVNWGPAFFCPPNHCPPPPPATTVLQDMLVRENLFDLVTIGLSEKARENDK